MYPDAAFPQCVPCHNSLAYPQVAEDKIPSRYGRRPLHVNWDVTASKGWSSKVDAQVWADNYSPLKSVHYEMLHRALEHCNEPSCSIKCGKCLQ